MSVPGESQATTREDHNGLWPENKKGRHMVSLFSFMAAICRSTAAVRRANRAIWALLGHFWFILPIQLTGEQVPPRNARPRSKQCF
jgi:hypothetical protein